jgi:hypothetical protein
LQTDIGKTHRDHRAAQLHPATRRHGQRGKPSLGLEQCQIIGRIRFTIFAEINPLQNCEGRLGVTNFKPSKTILHRAQSLSWSDSNQKMRGLPTQKSREKPELPFPEAAFRLRISSHTSECQ